MTESKLYAVGQRECWKLGDHYTRHSLAMTAEGLHKKSDIAAELAARDAEIERLTRDRDLWKERHDRERAAHAKNLTEQQRVEAERDRLRAENADLHRRFREMCDIAFPSSPTDVGHDETDVSSTDSIAGSK